MVLRGPQRHKAANVLRLRRGDTVGLFDGSGRQWEATVEEVARDEVRLRLGREMETPARPWRVAVALALVRGPRFEWAVEKCSELGAEEVIPLLAARCTARRPGDGRLARWRRIAAEAARQCGRADLPRVADPVGLEGIADRFCGYDAVVLASPCASELASEVLPRDARSVLVLIGPEGGFEEEEEAFVKGRGAREALLAPTLLRSETAAVVACAMCAAELARRCGATSD